MHKEGVTKSEFVKKLHEKIRDQIQKGEERDDFLRGRLGLASP